MKEKRSFFNMIFGKTRPAPAATTQLKLLSGYTPQFTSFGSEAYNSDEVRAAVDAIARNAAKLKPKRIRRDRTGSVSPVNDGLQYILSVRPNPYMDTYSFLYKVVTQLYMQNNAFIYIRRDDFGDVEGFYPVPASNVQLLEYGNDIYAKFTFASGQSVTIGYDELIHLRRFFYKHDFYGEPGIQAMAQTLEVINTANQGIINAVRVSASLRGILKSVQLLKDTDLKKRKDDFVKDYLTISEGASGVAALDGSMDYKEIMTQPTIVNAAVMSHISDKVCKYFGVSKEIITSSYNEDQWNAFYESVIEPIAIQMSLQFTAKVFTTREQQVGNEIIFEANRLEYASASTKISLARDLFPYGLFTIDEIREVFNLAPLPDGEGNKRIQTLNVVNASKADKYQVGEEPPRDPPQTEKGGETNAE